MSVAPDALQRAEDEPTAQMPPTEMEILAGGCEHWREEALGLQKRLHAALARAEEAEGRAARYRAQVEFLRELVNSGRYSTVADREALEAVREFLERIQDRAQAAGADTHVPRAFVTEIQAGAQTLAEQVRTAIAGWDGKVLLEERDRLRAENEQLRQLVQALQFPDGGHRP